MDAQGRTVVATSDGAGTWVTSREPGAAFGAPQRAAADFIATGAALGRDGEVLLTDVRSRVLTRPPGAAFGAPVPLPGAYTPFGPGAAIGANAAGDAVALYRGSAPVLASRRAADGTWATPTVLNSVNGAAGRVVKVAGDGTAVATFAQSDREPRQGGLGALMATTLRRDGSVTTAQLNAAGTEGDIGFGNLDADDAGRFAFAYNQAATTFGPINFLVKLQQPDGSVVGPAVLTANTYRYGDVVRVALSGDQLLATWTDHVGPEARLLARWLPGGTTVTLDRVSAPTFPQPNSRPPTLQFTTQPARRPDGRGRILLGLRCVSIGGSRCTGTLRLTAGPQRWSAGQARYAIGPSAVHRTRVTLTARARRTLRRQGHLTLTARGVPGRLLVRAPR